VVQAKISAAQDMQATTGIRFDATLQERTYDESGRALRELKRTGDLGNFHYVDNLSRSLRHTGNIFVDLIPKILDTPRVITILREDGGEERVKIDPSLGKPHDQRTLNDGRVERLYNPKLGEYAVTVTVGPSFATKRAEAADSMLAFMKAVPQSGPLIGDLIAKNMDWPGAEEIGARMASMLPPHMLDKKLDQLPPEAKALVSALLQQMQQLKQEHDKAVSMLGDKEADRSLKREENATDRESIARDFEAKLVKVAADLEAKLAAVNAKQADKPDETPVKMEKIASDFEAKIIKILADLEVARMKSEMDQQNKEHERKEKAKEEKTKSDDSAKETTKTLTDLMATVKEMSKPKRRKGKIKGPSGKVYELDITEQ